jgi:hypothetical protein
MIFSFDVLERTLKKVAEDHNFVGTIGIRFFRQWGNGLFATGYDVNNSWDYADIA